MKLNYLSTALVVITSALIIGCYTQLDLVDRINQYEYYYEGSEDSTVVEEYYVSDPYDVYYRFYGYWDPWWYHPRWGVFIGLSGWYGWYPWRYYHPYGYWYGHWWYYDYYPYWYGHRYAAIKNFGRRSFERRSVYKRPNNSNRVVGVRSSNKQLRTDSRRANVDKNRTTTNSRVVVRRTVRSDSRINQDRPAQRQPTRRSYFRNSPSGRQPSFLGRSSSNTGSSFRSAPLRGSSRSSSSGRAGSSSSRPSRR